MSEFPPEDFQHTLSFLQNVLLSAKHAVTGTVASDQSLLVSLVDNLRMDGFELQSFEQVTQHRSLQSGAVSGSSFYMDLSLIFVCVLCAGLASGLTQGLLSLDFLEMKIKSQSGTPKEKEYAAKVLPIIKNHHLLLVTLMLWNASATEALPIFLNSLVSEYIAIIISVTLVLMFGEIIPASILTGPKQLQIAASLTPLVYFVYVIFFPVAYPISKLLDWIIGHEDGMTLYSRREIATMMAMQHEEATRRIKSGDALRDSVHNDEITIIGGALKFRDMKVKDVMTTQENVFMISAKESLSYKTLYEIFKAGYSRIPVYDKDQNDIIGLLLAKDLIFVDPEDETPINNFVEFFGRRPVTVWHDQLLGEVLTTFRRERAHLAIVRDVVFEGEGDPYYKVVGIITLEDIIEEILGTEIEDEFDAADGEEGGTALNWHLRDMDLARLKSLRSKITDDTLSEDEINAIVNFLPKNVPQVNEYITKHKLLLPDVVKKSHVFLLKKQTAEGASKPHPNDIIVRKGKFTNTCILILQGRVKVVQELENSNPKEGESDTIRTEQIVGPWSTLCADALLCADGTFAPNFNAYIFSNDLRFLRISTIYTAAYTFSNNTRFVDRKRQNRGLVLSSDSGHRLRMASSPDSNYINLRADLGLSRNKTHIGTTGDQRESLAGENLLLRRSVTNDVSASQRRNLSGTDENTAWSLQDRKSILLASMGGTSSSGGPGGSFSTASSLQRNHGRSISEYYDPSEAGKISSSLTRETLKLPKAENLPPRINNVLPPRPSVSGTSDIPVSSSSSNGSGSLLTPLIRENDPEALSPTINKLHEHKK